MRSTRDYLRTSALAAAFALAIPLYANADLLPPPSDLGKSMGESSGVGEHSTAPTGSGNLNHTGGDQGAKNGRSGGSFGAINGPSVGGFGSGRGFGSVVSAASGSPANGGSVNGGGVNNTPTLGGLRYKLVTTPRGAGAGAGESLVMRDRNKPKPSFTRGAAGSRDGQVATLTHSLFGSGLGSPHNDNQRVGGVDETLQNWAKGKLHDNPGIGIGESKGAGEDSISGNLDITQPDWIRSLDVGATNNPKDLEQVLITNLVAPNVQLAAIPEPGTLLLLGAGMLLLRNMRRRRV